VPSNTFIRIPSSKMEQGCHQICKCHDGSLNKCINLPCVKLSSCTIMNQTIPHGYSIEIECNVCGCFAGEITCTKKQCRLLGDLQTSFMSLPCNCPPHYTPVCGSNGKTYPSSCIAKCAGLADADFTFGACESIDPCSRSNVKCKGTMKCFQNRQVCLSSPKNSCSQHKCMSESFILIKSTNLMTFHPRIRA
jgi:reversion-inducing cysteine-rich kazal motif protein